MFAIAILFLIYGGGGLNGNKQSGVEALQCYECNDDGPCVEFVNEGQNIGKCTTQVACRKISATVNGRRYVTRQCAKTTDGQDGCYRSPGAVLTDTCTCSSELCNSSLGLLQRSLIANAVFIFGSLFVLLFCLQ
ncbi:hypothetical protein ACOME3_000799 [Neoechinorhynchus agilis]